MSTLKKALKARELSSFLFLIVLFIIVSLINPTFASSDNISACFNSAVVYILIAVGMAFAIVVGEIDVSVGSNLGFVATVVGSLLRDGCNWLVAFAVGILIGALVGLINGWGVAVMGVPSLIFTLGVNGVLRGAMYVYADGAWVENLPKEFKDFSSVTLVGDLTVYFCACLVLVVVVHLLLSRTRRGRYFTAVGDNAGGATLVGISAVRTKVLAYVICGVMAALAGILFCSRIGFVTSLSGNGYEMKAVAACVLGGISLSGGVGSVVGAAIGAVIMSSISYLLVFMGFSSNYDNTITGVILITIVVAPGGPHCGHRGRGRCQMKKPSKLASSLKSWNTFLVVVLILEFVVFGIANSKFLRIQLLLTSINDFISICLISLFVTFVMITGGIDIQAGSIVGLTSIVIGVFWQDFGLNIWGAVLLAVAIAALCGALSGFFVAYCGVQAMVVTLGGQFLYAGLALLVSTLSSTESYQGISGFPDSFKAITSFKLFGVIPSQVLIFLAMTVIAWLLLHKSKYGRKVFLVGVNPQAAEYSGINTRRVILSTYVLSAVSASVAGIVLTSYLGTAKSDLGSTLTMNIITACVLGGTLSTGGKGSAIGTALASLIIGLMRFGMPLCFKVNTQYLDIPIGILLIVVVVGRAAASHPKTAALLARLKKKKAQPAAKAAK